MNSASRFGGVFAVVLVFSLLISPTAILYADIGTVSCSIITDTEFVPSWGKVYVAQDQYSRYIYQWMYWHNNQRLSWLNSNGESTYEPDAFFYNYDGLAYGDSPSGYWASDMPSPYVDTQFSDSSQEKAVTIGSANAVLLHSGVVYYTVTRMISGAGSSSWAKLSSQRGRRVPSNCYTTWCSFGCDNNSNIPTLSFTSFTAPGCRQYWWKWDIITNAPC